MDFTIRLKPDGTDETNAAADAVKRVREELEKVQKRPAVKPKVEPSKAKLPPSAEPKIETIQPKVEPAKLRELAREAESARKELARLQSEQRNVKAAGFDSGSRIAQDVDRRVTIAKGRVTEKTSAFLSAGGGGFDPKAYDAEQKAIAAREKAQAKGSGNAKGSLSSAIAVKTVIAQQAVEALKFAAGFAKANFHLALGWQGAARLSMISAQASMNWRRLFMGTNPRPLLDAIQRTSQLIDPRTFTGKTLGEFFVRASDGIFAMLAKAEPYVRLFFKGMLYGALQAEIAWLKLRIAIQPALNMLPNGIGLMTAFGAGALLVKGSFALMGVGVALGAAKAAVGLVSFGSAALTATAPLLPFIAAVGAIVLALDQAIKLRDAWDENSSSQIMTQLRSDLGIDSKEETDARMSKRQGIVSGDDYDKKYKLGKYAEKTKADVALPKDAAKQAAPAGQNIGKQLGIGVLQGMKDTEAKVAAGGRDLVLAAEAGAKSAAEIKSPARRWRREIGRNLGEGAALGLEDSASRMSEAGAAIIPGAPGIGIAGGAARGGLVVQSIGPFYGMPSGGEQQVRRWVFDALDDAWERQGVQA